MKYDETWWNVMKYDEMWWNVMKYDEMWWNMMKMMKWWNMMKCDEIWWNVMKYDEMWWNMMKCDEMWWNMMKCDDEAWWNIGFPQKRGIYPQVIHFVSEFSSINHPAIGVPPFVETGNPQNNEIYIYNGTTVHGTTITINNSKKDNWS